MIQVRISEDALPDLNDGYLFYESQEAGLGDYFAACLRADVEGLKISAGTHRIVYQDYHRLLSRVFPHGIFYTVEREFAVVWAVVDLRRDPAWTREKLTE
jgi:plasmid stabilization system protein ParE